MAKREFPLALPMVRNQYIELSRRSRRIPAWLPPLCFASFLVGIPFFLAIGAGIALSAIRKNDIKALDRFYQESIVPMCLTQVFGGYEYNPDGSVEEWEVRASGIVPMNARSFKGSTYISAFYRGLHVAMSNLTLKGRAGDEDAVVFKGPFAMFRMEHAYPGRIWIYEKGAASLSTQGRQILTGTTEFDRRYNVFADNLSLVPQVLSFRTMNAIMDAEAKLPGRIRFSIIDDRLYVAVEDGEPLLHSAIPKGQKQTPDIDELISRAMFEVCTLVDIADAMCFDEQ